MYLQTVANCIFIFDKICICRRVAKAYARAPVLTVNGSDDGFDGFRLEEDNDFFVMIIMLLYNRFDDQIMLLMMTALIINKCNNNIS